ncbi:putative ribonuclease H-like domain-containing protein [Tanacetum coccineum]
MTGNKDHLDDFKEFKGGCVTFGGSKGYITGEGRIKVGNLEFDSVSFVKELGHFNIFSISQICDKQHKVLFTETECLVVSSDFKMPDENQILIAKATSDESKLWHRMLYFRVTNSAGTLQTPNANASEEADEDEELIVVPTAIKHSATKVGPRKSSTNSKEEKFLTELQNLQTQEKEAFSTGISEDTPEILDFRRDLDQLAQKHLREVTTDKTTSTNLVNSGSGIDDAQPVDQDDSNMPELTIFNKPQQGIFDEASYDDEGMVHNFNNLPTEVAVSPIPTLRIHNIHPQSQILGDPKSSEQTRSRVQQHSEVHALLACNSMDSSRSTSWSKVTDRKGIDYDEVFAPVARIEAIRIFLAFASFMGFIVYQMNVKSAFLYGTIDEEVYVSQPFSFIDPINPIHVYNVVKALYGLHQAPRASYATLSTFLDEHGYRRGTIDKTLFIKKDKKDIMLVQVSLPRLSHLNAVREILSTLSGKPNLAYGYPKSNLFDLEAFSDMDKCLWIQKSNVDHGFQFLLHTKIHIDNESTICIVKNLVYHSKTKHIEIRHHFIRDSYEKKLIRVEKIHTDFNVADLLTKAFDGPRLYLDCMEDWSMTEVVKKLILANINPGFEHIVDFLKGTHIRYALDHNPTIYVSVIKQFWQTVTVITLDNGEQELKAIIDTHEYIISKSSVRNKLKLADENGITKFTNAKIFEGMANMGYPIDNTIYFLRKNHLPIGNYGHHSLHCIRGKKLSIGSVRNVAKCHKSEKDFLMYPRFLSMVLEAKPVNTNLYLAYQLTKKIFGNMNRGFVGVYRPLLANMIAGHDENQGEPQEGPVESQPPPNASVPSTSQPTTEPHPDQELETETELHGSSSDFVHTPPTQVETSSPELKSISPEPMEHTYDQPQPSPVQQPASPEPQPTSPPKSPPLQGPTSTYVEATRINVADLLHLVPQLVTRIDNLEKELKENKQTTAAVIVKLAAETLVQVASQKTKTYTRRVKSGLKKKLDVGVSSGDRKFKSASEEIKSGFTNISSGEVRVSQRKGKEVLEEQPQPKRSKKHIREEEASLAEIARIQAQEAAEIERKAKLQRLDALAAKRLNDEFEMSEQQRKRAAEVQQQAQYYTEEDWDLIRARMEAST